MKIILHVSLLPFVDGQIVRRNPPVLIANTSTKFNLALENWPKPKRKVVSQSPFCKGELF